MTTQLDAEEETHTLARRLIDDATAEILMTALPDSRKFRDGVEEAEIPVGGYYTISTFREVELPADVARLCVGVVRTNDAMSASYLNKGNFFIKVCGAKAEPDALFTIKQIAEKLKLAFNERRSSSATSNLLFTHARVNTRDNQSGQWYQVYMVTDWECEEVRRVATG
jgi:hypothetical protein